MLCFDHEPILPQQPRRSLRRTAVLPLVIEMKFIALLVALCSLCEPALAETSDCHSILRSRDRLACYDKAIPPTSSAKPVATSQKTSSKQDQALDPLSDENARLNAKLKNICRGC
jgi:hypothetical protein